MRSTRPLALASSANCGLASKAARTFAGSRWRSAATSATAVSRQDLATSVSCSRSGIGHRLFHVHVGGALIFGALGHLRLGLDLVEQASQENLAQAAARDLEVAFGLHPDLVGGRRGDIIAQAGVRKPVAWAMTNLPWARNRLSAAEISSASASDSAPIAQPHHHALDPGIARRMIERQHQIHHRLWLAGQRKSRGGGIGDRLRADPASAPCLDGRPSPRASPITSSTSENQDQKKGEFGDAVQHRRHDRAEPIQKAGHEESFALKVPYIAARHVKTVRAENEKPGGRIGRRAFRHA